MREVYTRHTSASVFCFLFLLQLIFYRTQAHGKTAFTVSREFALKIELSWLFAYSPNDEREQYLHKLKIK
jgi:hypothetical protein